MALSECHRFAAWLDNEIELEAGAGGGLTVTCDYLMATEYLSFAGWERNLKLSNDFVEVIITLEVGPRIISYRPVQGRSVFKLVREEAGKSKEDVWKIRGGHRLWSAPEDFGKEDSLCYALDNSEVEHSIEDEFTVRVSNLIEKPTKIRREMVVRLEQKSPKITVEHRITNQGDIEASALGAFGDGSRWLCDSPPVTTRQASARLLAQSLDHRVAIHRSLR
jgi:hypothetical protein